MKRAERLSELRIGQQIYDEKDGTKSYVVKSLEDKLVPYVIATDNSCHSLRKGIWFKKKP